MSRKRVEVHRPDGEYSHHISHPEAFSLVRAGKASWAQEFRSITMIDEKIIPRGNRPTEFTDVWKLKPSGGILVWQMRRGMDA